jgi:hypothetical protein
VLIQLQCDVPFQIPLDGLIVSNICCSDNGRIFFTSLDSLYEMDYYVSQLHILYVRSCTVIPRISEQDMVRSNQKRDSQPFEEPHFLPAASPLNFPR